MKKILLLLLAFGLTIQIQAQDLMDGLISVWEFDEVSGTVFSDAHGTHDGTTYNSVVPNQPGILGTACEFTRGTNDCIEFGAGLFFGQSAISISIWVNMNKSSTKSQYIVQSGSGSNDIVKLFVSSSTDQLAIMLTTNSTYQSISSNSMNYGYWNHIVTTYDGNVVRLYVNGVLEGERPLTGSLGEGTDQISCIGNMMPTSSYSIGGLIDQTAVWNRALTPDEVSFLYNFGSGVAFSEWGDPAEVNSGGLWLADGDNIISSTNGNVGIGTTTPTEKLVVDGKILAEEVKVQAVPASDYVFEPDYNLLSLQEVEFFIQQNKHLPDIPSAQEFAENGVGLGEMDDMLLRKIEELTLYMIAMKKEIQDLKEQNEQLASKIDENKKK